MDSITQIVLGAAVGEAVAGRRLGNRAMLWGAVGGTIPDLDVIANFWLTDLEALVIHRGITHSLLFAVAMPFLLAWLVQALYRSELPQGRGYRQVAMVFAMIVVLLLVFGVYREFSLWPAAVLLATACYLGWRLYKNYVLPQASIAAMSQQSWWWLFFCAITTHIALDCFTAYGTQVFKPFSDYRVAFNTIAVADPFFTVPFAAFVIAAAFQRRSSRRRSALTWIGIGLSSAYLLMTVYNKCHVDSIFAEALRSRQLPVERCRTSPTILNNFLWNCTAEGPQAYYVGLYSLFDSDPNLHYINILPKNPALVDSIDGTRAYQALHWFSDGYLMAEETDSAIILTDIRFGAVTDTITSTRDFVFRFTLKPHDDGYAVEEHRARPADLQQALGEFIQRVRGY